MALADLFVLLADFMAALVVVITVIITVVIMAASVLFVLSGPVTLARSHQQILAIFN
jgi:hypothetical protein